MRGCRLRVLEAWTLLTREGVEFVHFRGSGLLDHSLGFWIFRS